MSGKAALRSNAPAFATSPLSRGGILQRQCQSCGQHKAAEEDCPECKQKGLLLQRKAVNSAALEAIPPIVGEVLQSSGQPLDRATRTVMESRLQQDFSQVRVHTDAKAAAAASAVQAQAYTVRQDIVFGSGHYSPQSTRGQKLLAHELAHVVQQRCSQGSSSLPNEALEHQAEAIAETVATGKSTHLLTPASHAPLIQYRRMRRFQGTQLASLTVDNFTFEIAAVDEVVPPSEQAGHFNGYATENEALIAARRHSTATIVISDSEGLYHVFDTGWTTIDAGRRYSVMPYEAQGYRFVRWVNLVAEQQPSQSWADRVDAAHSLYQRYSLAGGTEKDRLRAAAEAAFVGLIVDALGVHRAEVHVAQGSSDIRPNMINFDLHLSSGNAEAGIAGALPATRDAQPPPVTLTLGRGAFRSDAAILTQMTFLHESAHVAHAERAIELLRQWQQSRSRDSFADWLDQQMRRRQISRADYDLTIEQTRGGQAATQTLAYLEGFMAGYHLLPTSTNEYHLFGQLIGISDHWAWAGHELNDRVIERLRNYYCRVMDADHRRAFDQFVATKLSQTESNPHGTAPLQALFYRHVVPFARESC